MSLKTDSDFISAVAPSSTFIYLPMIAQAPDPTPADLIVTDLVASGDAIMVVIKNAGGFAVVDAFWVDVYIDPVEPPSLNKIWQYIADQGVAWGVTGLIPAGGELVLTIGGEHYVPEESDFGTLLAGTPVWAQVNAVNYDTSYGNALESDEENNVFGPVLSTAGTYGRVAQSSDQVRSTGVAEKLPSRE